jgi:primase-polymerase (primpol)-like protein
MNDIATNDANDNPPGIYNGDIGALPVALEPLCAKDHWVAWKWTKNGSGKWTKPPFQARFPDRLAKNNDPATWSSHAEAAQAVKQGKGDGIGFALTGTEVAAIDLDHCRDPETAVIDAWALAIIDRAPEAYIEVTVSGCGLRIIGTARGNETHTKYKIEGRIVAGI